MFPEKLNMHPSGGMASSSLKLMAHRLCSPELPQYSPNTVDGVTSMAKGLHARGGFPQQERMIRDKQKSLDRATMYSYQAQLVKKLPKDQNILDDGYLHQLPVRALINPDKNKVDYDDKILSIRFDHGYECGDIFEWCRTNTYWLVYLQDLDEIAYFRGEIRRCDYAIEWLDENGDKKKTYAAIRGPVETKIDFIQKHSISIDEPNHSLHILMPKNEDTMKYFKRYKKFYLGTADEPDDKICWRIEATDSISTKGILELTAVEYYANETEDDVESGLVGAKVERVVEPEVNPDMDVVGPTFIKPKLEYTYYIEADRPGKWYIDSKRKLPVVLTPFTTERGKPAVTIKWTASSSGSFTIWYGQPEGHNKNFSKYITVESLF